MLEFIKMFIMGIVYTVLFPAIAIIFALYLVYAFFNYLVLEAINLFGFFFGYTFTVETELERKLEDMKDNVEKENADNLMSYEYLQETDLKGSDDHE